jgi:spore coat polysaccharide biosynthesis predicted glycosyltransferase SpsG
MLKHDMAISAGGMTLLELAKCGIPCLVLGSEKQEAETAIFMEKLGFGLNLGFSKKFPKKQLIDNTNYLIENYSLRKSMNKIGIKLVDGKGAKRIAKIIKTQKFFI